MPESLDRSLSSLSLSSVDSQPEDDWDRSLVDVAPSSPTHVEPEQQQPCHTPRNSIVFPAEDTPGRSTRYTSAHGKSGSVDGMGKGEGKRTLSELLRLHSEKGCGGKFSAEEASRIADVLGQWINASSSPYEGEDDFFTPGQSQDDISIASKRPIQIHITMAGRPRGRSESANSATNNSRPPSSVGFVPS
ncbi:hypothetical protein GALMADRAFT_257197 [Galerina marginata CBS 339.88]|uniref:Uncharacterized protein n=1 Tax=Galerina marginata (strain CBS 339.88) TaxID=685588 RepID=A0A067SNZ7_GALM3|nr:hypothetical protein GALMADRAFT_257197 [Galerina marginata CBS 339.88]